MSHGPGDDAAHLSYSYFVTSTVMVIRSVTYNQSIHLESRSLHCTATFNPLGKNANFLQVSKSTSA